MTWGKMGAAPQEAQRLLPNRMNALASGGKLQLLARIGRNALPASILPGPQILPYGTRTAPLEARVSWPINARLGKEAAPRELVRALLSASPSGKSDGQSTSAFIAPGRLAQPQRPQRCKKATLPRCDGWRAHAGSLAPSSLAPARPGLMSLEVVTPARRCLHVCRPGGLLLYPQIWPALSPPEGSSKQNRHSSPGCLSWAGVGNCGPTNRSSLRLA